MTAETIRVTTLPNGLRVASDPMETAQTTALGIWTNCGSRHETAATNGVAHLLEHMLFKGTPIRTAAMIAEEMENVGGQMNAYTGRENTAYYARVMQEDAGLALNVLADILQHSLFAAEELSREQQVVIQEIGQSLDTPDDIIYDYFQTAALPDQPAGRPILGSPDSVTAITSETLRGYIDTYYTPHNLVIAAAGAIDHDWLVAEAGRLFADLPSGMNPPVEAALYRGGEFRLVSDLEQAHVILGFGGIGLHDPDYYAAQVFSTALGGGMSSRLFQEVREKRGLVYTIHSFTSELVEHGLFGIYAGTGEDRLAELVPVLCDEMAKSAQGFSGAELARAKAQLKAATLMGLESSFNRAEALALALLIYDEPQTTAGIIARIEAVTEDDLRRVAGRFLATPLTLAAMGPVSALEPFDKVAGRLGGPGR